MRPPVGPVTEVEFAMDSPLEGAGFEPSVPLEVLTVGIVPYRLRGPFHASLPKTKFAADSALEGTGFEPSVPPSSIGRSDVPHRCPNGSGGERQLATQQETSSAFRCMSYADQDQADGLQARCGRPGS